MQRSGIDTIKCPGYQWEIDKLTADTTNESQEVSLFPAGDHKAHINRHAQRRPLLAGSDNTIISCYSHKNSFFGKTFLQKKK